MFLRLALPVRVQKADCAWRAHPPFLTLYGGCGRILRKRLSVLPRRSVVGYIVAHYQKIQVLALRLRFGLCFSASFRVECRDARYVTSIFGTADQHAQPIRARGPGP